MICPTTRGIGYAFRALMETHLPSPVARYWFEALDGHHVKNGHHRWTLRVLGIHGENGHLWIQFTRDLRSTSTALLHVPPSADVEDVWKSLRTPPSAGERIEIHEAAIAA